MLRNDTKRHGSIVATVITAFCGAVIVLVIAMVGGPIAPVWLKMPLLLVAVVVVATWVPASVAVGIAGLGALFSIDSQHHLSAFEFLSAWLAHWVAYAVVAIVASRWRAERRRARVALRIDPLTGLPNRTALVEVLEYERERSRRTGRPLTLACLDCDDFKRINDRDGHAHGDTALQSIAAILIERLREDDIAVRMGGDEFILLLPEMDATASRETISRVQESLRSLAAGESDTMATCSIGCVTFVRCDAPAAEMLRIADEAMYAAKKNGKNRIEYRTHTEESP